VNGKLRRRGALSALLITVFIDMVGFGIIIPFTPFWAEKFGAGPSLVTLLFATYSIFAFGFSFLWGWASDRCGRKPILLLSLMGSVMSFLWLGFADALWMLFAARALGGIFGANISVGQAYIADVTKPSDRAKGLGLFGAAFGLGFTMGPAIGGLLAGPDPTNPDFQTPFFVAAGVSFIGVIFGLFFLPEPERNKDHAPQQRAIDRLTGFSKVFASPVVAGAVASVTLMGFVMGGLESTFAIWTERVVHWGPRETGYFFGYIGVLLVIIQGGMIGPLVKRFGEARLAPIGVLVMAVGIGILPWCATVPLIVLSGAFISVGFGLGQPCLNALISRNAPADSQGTIMGASQSAQSLARILGPTTAGFLFATLGRDSPYIMGGIVLLIACALASVTLRQRESL